MGEPDPSGPSPAVQETKPIDHGVIDLAQFEQSFPKQTPFFSVCTGPYKISFRQGTCLNCVETSFVRQYAVKNVTLTSLEPAALTSEDRERFGQMDSIALANHVIHAKTWVTSRDQSAFIGLDAVHSALPKWVIESTALLINKLMTRRSITFSKLSFTKSVVGSKRLTCLCPTCGEVLPSWQSNEPQALTDSHTLLDGAGEPLIYSWPAVLSELSQF